MEKNLAKPLVSVIIPTIKYDDYTEAAISSIFSQTYKNWEIILVLDGAPKSDLPQWILTAERIKIVEHLKRLGTPKSLNDGADISRGEFIARLDADDIAHPDRLGYQVGFLQKHENICCIGTGGYLIDSKGTYLGEMGSAISDLDIRFSLLSKNRLVHSSVMYRKTIFDAIGGYNLIMTRMQDYDLFLRMAQKSPLAYSNEYLSAYRTHAGQHSRKTSPFKRYTAEIIKQRNSLRKTLKASKRTQCVNDIQWYGAQVLRYLGLRKPGYLLNSKIQTTSKPNIEWIRSELA